MQVKRQPIKAKLILIVLILCFTACSHPQSDRAQDQQGESSPSQHSFLNTHGASAPSQLDDAEVNQLAQDLRASCADFLDVEALSFDLQRVNIDRFQQKHVVVQQKYKGLRVFGGESIVHYQADGQMRSIRGHQYARVSMDITPQILREDVLNIALPSALRSDMLSQPLVELIIMPWRDRFHLAWLIDLDLSQGGVITQPRSVINALDGSIILKYDRVDHASTTISGYTQYHGAIELSDSDLLGEQFGDDQALTKLYDSARQIDTRDMMNGELVNLYSSETFSVMGTDFTTQVSAFSAHHAISKSYDYFYQQFLNELGEPYAGFSGYGLNEGCVGVSGDQPLNVLSNYGVDYVNASFIHLLGSGCSLIAFGSGDGVTYGHFASLDMAGHEFMHGITQHNVGFHSYGQSGSINEAFADIFGLMVERSVTPNEWNWSFGEDIVTPDQEDELAFRYLNHPTLSDQHPDHYDDLFTGSADGYGKHLNAGIPGHAFYLMVNGGTHASRPEQGAIAGSIPIEDAAYLWWHTLRHYLVASDQFIDLRDAMLEASVDLFGQSSPEYHIVQDAWYLVGLGAPSPDLVLEADLAPVAVIIPSGQPTLGQSLTLSGSESFDPNGYELTYYWSLNASPEASMLTSGVLQDQQTPLINLTPDVIGTYAITLTVSDGAFSDSETFTFSVEEPVTMVNVLVIGDLWVGFPITLEAHVDQQMSSAVSYTWSISQSPESSSASEMMWPNEPQISLTPDAEGSYAIDLTISDEDGEEVAHVTTSLEIETPPNQAPTVILTSNASEVTLYDTLEWSAAESFDHEGSDLSFTWELLNAPEEFAFTGPLSETGPSVAITATHSGYYLMKVTVTDGELTTVESLGVTLENQSPQAVTESNLSGYWVDEPVILDASASYDLDGHSLSYQWELLEKPIDSTLTTDDLIDGDQAIAHFTPDTFGLFVLSVTVSDGELSHMKLVWVNNTLPSHFFTLIDYSVHANADGTCQLNLVATGSREYLMAQLDRNQIITHFSILSNQLAGDQTVQNGNVEVSGYLNSFGDQYLWMASWRLAATTRELAYYPLDLTGEYAIDCGCIQADLNGDNLITVTDHTMYLQMLATNNLRADFDGSGLVNNQDFLHLLQYQGRTCTHLY